MTRDTSMPSTRSAVRSAPFGTPRLIARPIAVPSTNPATMSPATTNRIAGSRHALVPTTPVTSGMAKNARIDPTITPRMPPRLSAKPRR